MSGPGCPWDSSPRAQVAGKLSLVWEGEGSPQRREPLPEWRALRGGRVPWSPGPVVQGRGACTGRSCQSCLQGLWPARQVPTQQELREGDLSSAQRLLPETRGSDWGRLLQKEGRAHLEGAPKLSPVRKVLIWERAPPGGPELTGKGLYPGCLGRSRERGFRPPLSRRDLRAPSLPRESLRSS